MYSKSCWIETGEVLYYKSYMSLRPPPKISLRHDWARGEVPLGSTVDQQPEGEVVRQSQEEVARRAKIFQTTQPIPKPICDRSGQLDNTQDVFVVKGETSRSHEINEKGFHGELCSSDGSGQPDDTHNVLGVQTRLSEENKNVRVEQTRDRSGQPDNYNIAVPDAPAVHHEIEMLNIDNDSGIIISFRALQGHSGRNLIDPSLQDNVVIQRGLFHHIYHIGCAFNLHSIINNGLIPEVRIQARDKQYSFCPLIQETKIIKILNILT